MTAKTIFDLPVHPAAEIFPMIADDELNELAEDIKANGLDFPIVIKDGVLIDGRNRREACKRAGVMPATTELNGDDPIRYIYSNNVKRRNMTKGQTAMVTAMMFPEPEKGGRGKRLKNSRVCEVDGGYVSKARTVLRYAGDLSENVLSGAQSLSVAYQTAQQRKAESESEDTRLKTLQADAPDLAALVIENDSELNEQWAAYKERLRNEEAGRRAMYSLLLGVLNSRNTLKHADNVITTLEKYPDEFKLHTNSTVEEFYEAMKNLNEWSKQYVG